MSSVNKILLWIRICNFLSYTVMYSFVEFESLKRWLVLPLLTCRFLPFAIFPKFFAWPRFICIFIMLALVISRRNVLCDLRFTQFSFMDKRKPTKRNRHRQTQRRRLKDRAPDRVKDAGTETSREKL